MSYQLLLFVVLLLSYPDQGRNALSPQGCSYLERADGEVKCNFEQWIPPLLDEDFKPESVSGLKLYGIQGSIPAGAFSGLNGPSENRETYIELNCDYQSLNLSQDIFTPNLYWVKQLDISECCLGNGLPPKVMKHLKGLEFLHIEGCEIQGLVAHDALAGLTNLMGIVFEDAPIKDGKLPAGFFDGLKNLISIYLSDAELNLIPPNLFSGLVNLEQIYINHNNLQTLPSGLFDELHSLQLLRLSGNPWNCSCELIWLLDIPQITGFKLKGSNMIFCTKTSAGHSGNEDRSKPTLTLKEITSQTDLYLVCLRTYVFEDKMKEIMCKTDSRSIGLEGVDELLNCSSIHVLPTVVSSTQPSTTEITKSQTLSRFISTETGPDTRLPATTNKRLSSEIHLYKTSAVTSLASKTSIAMSVTSTETVRSRNVNDLLIIVLASTVSALTLLLIIAGLICRCACQNKSGERLNRVNNDEESKVGSDSHR